MTGRHGSHSETFLVLAGIGHDALTVQRVPDECKRHLGWLGYLGPAASTVLHRPTRMRLRLDDGDPVTLDAWSVLAVNCGRIPGGSADRARVARRRRVARDARGHGVLAGHWVGIMAKGMFDLPHAVPGLGQHAARRLRVLGPCAPAQRR